MKSSPLLLGSIVLLAVIGICFALPSRRAATATATTAHALRTGSTDSRTGDRTAPAAAAGIAGTPVSDSTGRVEVATLAGGCFWCLEAAFSELRGVRKAKSGYAGGTAANPTYEEVSTGTTGHAETVQVTFDPDVISYRDLLEVFFTIHDPTTLNRQGADVGTQYRSVIFYNSPEQKRIAEEVIAETNAAKIWDGPIVTEVVPLKAFYPAEAYHDDYYRRNQGEGYCRLVISPKLEKLRKTHQDLLKK
jgi:peptide-methionine (S)-S-oxide reductase